MQKEGDAVLALEGVHYSLWYYSLFSSLDKTYLPIIASVQRSSSHGENPLEVQT
jgi:hypothetical protein